MQFYIPEPLYLPIRGQISLLTARVQSDQKVSILRAMDVLDDFSFDREHPGYYIVATSDSDVMASIVHAADLIASDQDFQMSIPELTMIAALFVENARHAADCGELSTGPLKPPKPPSDGEIGMGVVASIFTVAKWIAVAATVVITSLAAGDAWGFIAAVGALVLFPITFLAGPWIAGIGLGNWTPVVFQLATIAISTIAFLLSIRARRAIAWSRLAR